MQGAGVMATALALTAAGTVVTVRMMRRNASKRDEIVMGVLGPSIGALHMLIVAFALVAGWQSVTDADTSADNEAKRAVELYWSARAVPDPVGTAVQGYVRAYAQVAIHKEWPMMRRGDLGNDSGLILDQARLRLLQFHPKDVTVEQRRLDAMDRLRGLSGFHDERASLAGSRLPPMLLLGVIGTSLLMIFFPLVMGLEGNLHSLAWAITTSMLFTVTVLVVFQFERPYGGAVGIRPGALVGAQEQFARIDTYPPTRLAPPKK